MADIINFQPVSSSFLDDDWEPTNLTDIVLLTLAPAPESLSRSIQASGYRLKEKYEDVGCFTYVYERVDTNGAA